MKQCNTSVKFSYTILHTSFQPKSTNAGFCPEIKFIGTNGPLSLKKVSHFRKYWGPSELPIYDANLDKLKRLKNC